MDRLHVNLHYERTKNIYFKLEIATEPFKLLYVTGLTLFYKVKDVSCLLYLVIVGLDTTYLPLLLLLLLYLIRVVTYMNSS